MTDLRDDGIYVMPHKTVNSTGIRRVISWSDELRAARDLAKTARPVDISPWLFCNSDGAGYFDEEKGTASGWDSIWQRFMKRVLLETKVCEPFTAHDLRRKAGSDSESLERARQLLGHADARITQDVYRVRPEVVRPLR